MSSHFKHRSLLKHGARVFCCWAALQLSIAGVVFAQRELYVGYDHLFTTPLGYTVHRTLDSIEVDGKANEVSWQKAHWSESFTDIEGNRKPAPAQKTRFKMLWNDQYIFIFAELEEKHIWATLNGHDQVIFHDNDFEVFIDPNGDSQTYFEIEVNAINTVFDLFLPKAYRDGGSALIPWNASDMKSAVFIDGTLNNSTDEDSAWYVEMAIPFRDVSLGNTISIPRDGDHWRVNFSRVEWEVMITDGHYSKQSDPATDKLLPEHNWVWSPQGVINMHYPERWGYARFSSKNAGDRAEQCSMPPDLAIKNFLWLLYYKQRDYRNANGRYAADGYQLGIPKPSVSIGNHSLIAKYYADPLRFVITLHEAKTNTSWQITDQGMISTFREPKKIK
jgi:hypothetical protein